MGRNYRKRLVAIIMHFHNYSIKAKQAITTTLFGLA